MRRALAFASRVKKLLDKERRSSVPVPLAARLRMWRQGFLAESYVLYGLDRHPPADYLPDYHRFVRTPDLNDRHDLVLSNKLFFAAMLRPFAAQLPRTFALVSRGRIHWLEPLPASIEAYCKSSPGLVLKPVGGGAGVGIMFVTAPDGALRLNGEAITAQRLHDRLAQLDDYLVTELIEQAEYSATIFPDTPNTIRMLTMVRSDGEPFLARAVHRFGASRSLPVDNWTQGGLSAEVDVLTGTLGPGVSYPASGALRWHDRHPETGVQITGVTVPGWAATVAGLLRIARALAFIRYCGWDVLMSRDASAFKILEGNHATDVNLIQVHGPLLRDPAVRRFYRENRVIG